MNTYSHNHRRGSIYITVLASAMIIAVIGVAAATVVRVERRDTAMSADFAQARLYAQSAIEKGLHLIQTDPNWRLNFTSGVWASNQPIGNGTYSLEGIDLADGNLANSATDALVLKTTGVQGGARCKLQLTLTADVDPLDALQTAIHAASITVMGGKTLTATGAPASTNGLLELQAGALLTGDAEAASLSNGGTITGTVTVPAPAKDMPDASVISDYAALATPIAVPTTIDKQVLAPGYNPWGATNPDGVYLISLAGTTLTITNTRIHGTLVVQNPGGKVVLDSAVFLQNYRADYPVLIVDGDVELLYPSDGNSLSELTLLTNFNPLGAGFLGEVDTLLDDEYPSEIQGLVHVTGTLLLKQTARVRGAIICENAVTADDNNEIVHEPNLYTNPPVGYTKPPVMRVSPGTWHQVVD